MPHLVRTKTCLWFVQSWRQTCLQREWRAENHANDNGACRHADFRGIWEVVWRVCMAQSRRLPAAVCFWVPPCSQIAGDKAGTKLNTLNESRTIIKTFSCLWILASGQASTTSQLRRWPHERFVVCNLLLGCFCHDLIYISAFWFAIHFFCTVMPGGFRWGFTISLATGWVWHRFLWIHGMFTPFQPIYISNCLRLQVWIDLCLGLSLALHLTVTPGQ